MSQNSSDAGDVRWKRANYDDFIFLPMKELALSVAARRREPISRVSSSRKFLEFQSSTMNVPYLSSPPDTRMLNTREVEEKKNVSRFFCVRRTD